MTNPNGTAANRPERRKMRTRAAPVRAAQTFIAAGTFNVPALEITHAADVGMSSFHNHFDSKEKLFRAAVTRGVDDIGAFSTSRPRVTRIRRRRSPAVSGW